MNDLPWASKSMSYLDADPVAQWAAEAAEHGRAGSSRLLEVAVPGAVPAPVIAALRVPADAAVIRRRRLVLADDRPVELMDSYYPAALAGGTPLALAKPIRGGATAQLALLGYRPDRCREYVTAEQPTADERRLLQLGEHQWVLKLLRQLLHEGHPVEVDVIARTAPGRGLAYDLALPAPTPPAKDHT
ncbi:UTRA domain-containing protein [Amycolatopsis sp. OK19-0408]|uniref:UTRA domain-containing protein n=1 Tax=Amycolatopsis iheyensis TaxID=2945988 RepID=A0A9X2NGG2_9PSEU|nr:UTRA domain-containing protein [Amycolatopsis iheyensis]MCR6488356.1 UTRA domain-containing protein [Amycolatopsis iheyensis]